MIQSRFKAASPPHGESVGGHVAAAESDDMCIVRRPESPGLEALEPHSAIAS
ncbi:hypothetical protein NJ7G_1811 [Natrinema sp. J7-2]|nr:hypothetical protein NJ7G_1811 [Natrinema sp. J7-2]